LAGAPNASAAALRFGDYTGNYYDANGVGADDDYGYDPFGTGGNVGTLSVADCLLFAEFEVIDQPLVFFLPDVNAKITNNSNVNVGWTGAKAVYNALIEWVESPQTNGRHFVIVEGEGEETPDEAIAQSGDLVVTSRAAMYYPQVYIKDPIGRSSLSVRKIGPSGATAGLFLYTDRLNGPFKAPAGIGTKLVDAIAIERPFGPKDLDILNTGFDSTGSKTGNNVVNAIRNIPGAGVVVMGARTLKQDGTANRYINMRRSLTYIEKRLNDLAAFAVFENNTEVLWGRLITILGVFLNDYRNQGGLRGTTVAESFYIKCDEENNPQQSIAAGQVHIEIGVALEYPAEFVVINLSQKTAE
jgi:phage tail sheath protein FI